VVMRFTMFCILLVVLVLGAALLKIACKALTTNWWAVTLLKSAALKLTNKWYSFFKTEFAIFKL
jgi:hypothetical protein